MKVILNLNTCTGHARCQVFAPDIFGTDDVEGKAVLLLETVPPALSGDALRAAKACPERAITIIGDNDEQAWPPLKA